MNNAPLLRELQTWLQWVITDPRGVAEALKNPRPVVEKYQDRYSEPTNSQYKWIETGKAVGSARLSIYAEGYFFRILECLEKDFSKTYKVLGQELFANAVAEYLKVHPSRFYSIDEAGSKFAKFISEYEDAIHLFPWMGDLALIEWMHIEAFYANESPTVDKEWRQQLAGVDVGKLCFQIDPSVYLHKSEWPLPEIIRAIEQDELQTLNSFQNKHKSFLLLYRNSSAHVVWSEVTDSEFQILKNLKKEYNLEEAILKTEDINTGTISKNFSDWVENGILCGVLNRGDK